MIDISTRIEKYYNHPRNKQSFDGYLITEHQTIIQIDSMQRGTFVFKIKISVVL